MRSWYVIPLFIMLASFLACQGCAKQMEPPNVDVVEKMFLDNYEDIEYVVEYIVSLECTVFYIDYAVKTPKIDYEEATIEESKVIEALDNLLSADKYKQISKSGKTIEFLQWNRLADCACGVAYSIDQSGRITVEYLTDLIPLTEEGWYYYVADYNLWRVEH